MDMVKTYPWATAFKSKDNLKIQYFQVTVDT